MSKRKPLRAPGYPFDGPLPAPASNQWGVVQPLPTTQVGNPSQLVTANYTPGIQAAVPNFQGSGFGAILLNSVGDQVGGQQTDPNTVSNCLDVDASYIVVPTGCIAMSQWSIYLNPYPWGNAGIQGLQPIIRNPAIIPRVNGAGEGTSTITPESKVLRVRGVQFCQFSVRGLVQGLTSLAGYSNALMPGIMVRWWYDPRFTTPSVE